MAPPTLAVSLHPTLKVRGSGEAVYKKCTKSLWPGNLTE